MISAVMPIFNSERRLREALASLKSFDEVVVVDNGSTDNSIEIAKSFPNVKLFPESFSGFGKMRNEAASHATHDWILAVDSDEVLSDELVKEIYNLKLDPKAVYDIPFKNYFAGHHIKGCGWHPESHIRLYNRIQTSFDSSTVHEGIIREGLEVEKLKNPIHHYSYDDISDFLIKMERYTTLFAKNNRHKKRASPLMAFGHGLWAFIKSYFLKRGLFLGYRGFLISFYQAETSFYKYIKLYHENMKEEN